MEQFKRICLSGSMSVLPKMIEVRDALCAREIAVEMPSMEEPSDYAAMPEEMRAPHKNEMIRKHLARIENSDALLVVNEKLKGVEGYIGANTFLEMGFAFALAKPIFLLNRVPDQANKDEILGLYPTELGGDLSALP